MTPSEVFKVGKEDLEDSKIYKQVNKYDTSRKQRAEGAIVKCTNFKRHLMIIKKESGLK
jgi:hypothetical protein